MLKINSPGELEELRKDIQSKRDPNKPCITICAGTGCLALGSDKVITAFEEEIVKQGLVNQVDVRGTGCPGFCEKGPVVVIYPKEICYISVTPEDAHEIVSQTLLEGNIVDRLLYTDPNNGEKAVHEIRNTFL